MKNIDKIISELDELKKIISGWDIPRKVDIEVDKKINNIKTLLGIKVSDNEGIVFEYENKDAVCKIIKTISGEFYFQIFDKKNNYLIDSAETGVDDDLDYDGVYPSFEICKKELKKEYKPWIGEKLEI